MSSAIQTIKRPPVKPLKGFLMILLIFVCVMALSFIEQFIALTTSVPYTWLIPWLACGGIVFCLIKRYTLGFCYTVSGGMLYLERTLGTYRKLLDSLPLTDIIEFQSADALLKKHPEIKNAAHLTLPEGGYEKMGCYYKKGSLRKIAVLQPNEEIKALLWNEEKRRESAAEKWGEGIVNS